MKKTEVICDFCGLKGAREISVVTGRKCDAAGSMEDVTFDADICIKCSVWLLQKYAQMDKAAILSEEWLKNL